MELRRLVLVSLQHEATFLSDELKAAGWDITHAPGVPQTRHLLNETDHALGLVVFGGSEEAPWVELEDLGAAFPRMEWVALIPDTCVVTDPLRDLLLDTFTDYLRWPRDRAVLTNSLIHASERASLRHDRFVSDSKPTESVIIGNSPAMRYVSRSIRKIAAVDAPTLITGESGTGKELAAIAIHRRSARADGSFVAVNCGALPADLIQSELFGHERGAFTGAYYAKKGLLEAAAGGTVFLDEIGDLSLDLQTNLLRFLQERTINRIGSTSAIPLQVRVIAATHVNLENAVKERRFREDLYYRLNVLHLAVPPLRERIEDIPLLAHHFFDKFSNEKPPRVKGFGHRALRAMVSHLWPGNVRELINRIRRAMAMCDSTMITPADLGLDKRARANSRVTLDEARDLAEKDAILLTLQSSDYNISQAARQLAVSRVTLYRLMQKHGIKEVTSKSETQSEHHGRPASPKTTNPVVSSAY